MTRRELIRFWISTGLLSVGVVLSITTHDPGTAVFCLVILVFLIVWMLRVRRRASGAHSQLER